MELVFLGVYVVMYAVGIAGHYLVATREVMLRLTPAILFLLGASVFAPLVAARQWCIVVWAVATYLVTFMLEAIGVATGDVFGSYEYGPTLGLKLLDVPLVIGFNWVVVVLGAITGVELVAERLRRRMGVSRQRRSVSVAVGAVLAAASVGLVAVGFDLLLEPVAIGLDYWHWAGVVVPLRNYVAWFLIAALVSFPVFLLRPRFESRVPLYYLVVQTVFIAALNPLVGGGAA